MTIAFVLLSLFKHMDNDVIYPAESNKENSEVRWEKQYSEDQSPIISASDMIIKIPKYMRAANSTFCANNVC